MSWRLGSLLVRPAVSRQCGDTIYCARLFSSDLPLHRESTGSQRTRKISAFRTRGDLRLQRESEGSQRTSKISASQTQAIREVEKSVPENRLYTRRVSAAKRERDWPGVLRAFEDAPMRNTILYNATIHAALLCRRLREGAGLYNKMCDEGITATSPTYVSMIHIFARLGRHGKVDELWQQMSSRDLLEGNLTLAYAAIISAKARAGDVTAAARFLSELAKRDMSKVDSGHFEAVLHACARARDGAAARRCLKAMRGPGVKRSAMAYSSCMRALFGSPLPDVQEVGHMMTVDRIDLNAKLLDNYVEALLGKEAKHLSLHGGLKDVSKDRADALRNALADAEKFKSIWTSSVRRVATMFASI